MISSLIYTGKVKHHRLTPKPHTFSYPLFMFCFDINAIESTFQNIAHISIEKFNLFSFRRKNYFTHSTTPLDQAVRLYIEEKKNIYPTGKIYLLTHLSCMGYCVNPISLYFIFKPNSEELDFLIVEVTNTPWHERRSYILSDPTQQRGHTYRYHFKKEMHVSPFLVMDYEYQLNLKLNNNKIIVHIENHQQGQLHFGATLSLSSRPLNNLSAADIFLRFPFMTHKVTVAIYWQAFKLWLKGVPFQSHPKTKDHTHG